MEPYAPLNGRLFVSPCAAGTACREQQKARLGVSATDLEVVSSYLLLIWRVWNSLLDQILQTLPGSRDHEEIFLVPCGWINELLNMKNTLKGAVSMLPVTFRG